MGGSKHREETGVAPQGEGFVPKEGEQRCHWRPIQIQFTQANNRRLVLFMKGKPGEPECRFSATIAAMLDFLRIDFVGINVLKNPALRAGVKAFRTGRPYRQR
jgi:hypothetical protein